MPMDDADAQPQPQPLPCPWEPVDESYVRYVIANTQSEELRAMACEVLYLRRVRQDLAARVRVLRAGLEPKPN